MKMMFWSKFSFLLKWIKKKKKNFNLHLTQGRITNNPNCIINTKANNPSFITFHLHELALRNAFWNLCLITVRSISVKHRNRELWLISAIPSQLMLTSPSQNKGCYRSKSLWLMEGWEKWLICWHLIRKIILFCLLFIRRDHKTGVGGHATLNWRKIF